MVADVVAEKNLDLVELFEHEYTGHDAAGPTDDPVVIRARPLAAAAGFGPAAIRVLATRLIVATGLDLAPLKPLRFTAPPAVVHSLAPSEVLTPRCTYAMRFGPDAGKPIIVLGSGKTALDTMCVGQRAAVASRSMTSPRPPIRWRTKKASEDVSLTATPPRPRWHRPGTA